MRGRRVRVEPAPALFGGAQDFAVGGGDGQRIAQRVEDRAMMVLGPVAERIGRR